MRTLVIGIPLPHVSFDNHSFVSAPSFGDYQRIIVEMESVSKVVDEVVSGSGEHRNFAGHQVHNAPTATTTFGLADLLSMRRREAEWFLAHGGTLACFAHPDVEHGGIAAMSEWSRYAWLPAPDGLRYSEHLLSGFGQPGVVLTDEDHPFAPYVQTFGQRLAYRAVIDEAAPNFSGCGRTFIRSAGDAAIGADLKVSAGYVILLPPLLRFETERTLLAQTLFDCLERWHEQFEPKSAQSIRKDVS